MVRVSVRRVMVRVRVRVSIRISDSIYALWYKNQGDP